MRLKSIKLAGFKSFADPTVVPLQSPITAIVGPNGCGKSNIIDAVRCVLSGAARQLRGDTMSDIPFNGSAGRKPVGQASVEMLFGNEDGSLGGEYAAYPEISIRREINRDGTSDYFLNNARCRRRDIVDIFLGTGLGPQSYAIIEQGMISRIIEAKPEELRIHLEEAAGISKYKERRRETENRIQHARENLERLNDHRNELEKQLAHLKRQASAAERYKELKQEERLLKAQLQALHWRELSQQIQSQSSAIQTEETQLEARIATQRQLGAEIEKLRAEQMEFSDVCNEVQSRFYSLGAEIARLEQQVKSGRERRQQLQNDLQQLNESQQEIQQHYEQEQFQIEELQAELEQLEPRLTQAKNNVAQSNQQLQEAEQAMTGWQVSWDEFNTHAAQTARTLEVEQTRMQHLQQSIQVTQQKIARIISERDQIDITAPAAEIETLTQRTATLKQQIDELQQNLQELNLKIQQQREQERNLNIELDQQRNQLQQMRGRRASLEALQQAALGKNDQAVTGWLTQQQLQQQPRLAENLIVAEGWEIAVETVLNPYLEAVGVQDLQTFNSAIDNFATGKLVLYQTHSNVSVADNVNQTSLLSKITSSWPLAELLTGIYIAENLTEALTNVVNLQANESIVTRDGIWLRRNWLRISKNADAKAGVLQREKELQELNKKIIEHEQDIASKAETLTQLRNDIAVIEQQREQLQQQYREASMQQGKSQAQLSAEQAKHKQLLQRLGVIEQEINEYQTQLTTAQQQLTQAEQVWQQASTKVNANNEQKQQLLDQRDVCRQQLDAKRQAARATKENQDELQMQLETSRHQLHFLNQSVTRADKQLQEITQRSETLQQTLQEVEAPLQAFVQELEQLLAQRLSIEHELTAARQQLNQVEHQLREQERQRNSIEEAVQTLRQQLEQLRMKLQASQIRQSTHQEKIVEANFELETLLTELVAEAEINVWEEQITRLEGRIQRLGAINLAAIDEYNQLAERKTYLDAQNNDLIEALTTLETAIRKIDQETKARLQETYDKVNTEFNSLFQRIFNGGNAALEMTEGDLLSTGIIVRAQPPGKRNSTIHLLSGGEKALTAVALVFAMFQLNPAPFCILDEVDAPLDDVNVGRFCNLLKEMAGKTQFIFISHNKLTIEIADQLIGVTMKEPGVSRLVAVDIQQAIEMATA